MRLPKQFTWDWFTHQAHRRWPKSPPPPSLGCWREATLWLRENRHLLEARGLLKHAIGNRALALYWAARESLIPERGEALSALLRRAPGDRALALYYAARESLILGSQAKGA